VLVPARVPGMGYRHTPRRLPAAFRAYDVLSATQLAFVVKPCDLVTGPGSTTALGRVDPSRAVTVEELRALVNAKLNERRAGAEPDGFWGYAGSRLRPQPSAIDWFSRGHAGEGTSAEEDPPPA
jgi:hypothetical protein